MRHDSRMSEHSSTAPLIQVLAILGRDPAAEQARRLLLEEGLAVQSFDVADRREAWQGGASAEAVVVDEALEPAEVAEALERGWIRAASPLFVVARRLPDRDRYLAWLEAGAWDILKIPLESVALALRLRNMLEGKAGGDADRRARRYSFESLALAADEALALAQRYGRPMHCVGVAMEWPDAQTEDVAPLMERVADATQRLTRRYDLIGLGERQTMLILLPDTDARGTQTFCNRLVDILSGRLREWGVAATLRAESVSAQKAASGRDLLDAVVEQLVTPR